MRAVQLRSPGGLDNLALVDLPEPGETAPGEIRVRLHASSLNYHDLGVVTRPDWQADGRIPMSDGAGVIEAIDAGVAEFKPGDHVVSCFFPTWQDGPATLGDFSTVPGDGVDGYAREAVTSLATSFTLAPKGIATTLFKTCGVPLALAPRIAFSVFRDPASIRAILEYGVANPENNSPLPPLSPLMIWPSSRNG